MANDAIKEIAKHLGSNAPETSLPKIVFKRTTRYNGAVYRNSFSGELFQIVVSTNGVNHQAFSLAHEIGHIIDAKDSMSKGFKTSWASELTDKKTFTGLDKVMEAIKNTAEIQWIKDKKTPDGKDIFISDKFKRYMLSGRETFARAFSQYVEMEGNNKALKSGLEHYREKSWFQWSDESFKPIRSAMREYLKGRKRT